MNAERRRALPRVEAGPVYCNFEVRCIYCWRYGHFEGVLPLQLLGAAIPR